MILWKRFFTVFFSNIIWVLKSGTMLQNHEQKLTVTGSVNYSYMKITVSWKLPMQERTWGHKKHPHLDLGFRLKIFFLKNYLIFMVNYYTLFFKTILSAHRSKMVKIETNCTHNDWYFFLLLRMMCHHPIAFCTQQEGKLTINYMTFNFQLETLRERKQKILIWD